jgi:hypothetical protein
MVGTPVMMHPAMTVDASGDTTGCSADERALAGVSAGRPNQGTGTCTDQGAPGGRPLLVGGSAGTEGEGGQKNGQTTELKSMGHGH